MQPKYRGYHSCPNATTLKIGKEQISEWIRLDLKFEPLTLSIGLMIDLHINPLSHQWFACPDSLFTIFPFFLEFS